MSKLFNSIVTFENLYKSYKKTQMGQGKYKKDAMIFARNETYNLLELQKRLINGTYKFGGYVRFMVYEPKERIIHAPKYIDKIVQLAMNEQLKEIFNPSFIYDSYACIDDKGTHRAVERVSHFMRKGAWQFGEDAFILKVDVRRFFYSIDRTILKRIYRKKIKCSKTLWLLDLIINSADEVDKVGLPLGNTLSQLCANIYMNQLDQYCKRMLQLKYYVRYADDIAVIVENKEKALEVQEEITQFLFDVLHLEVHEGKTRIFPIAQGVNTLGYKIYTTHRLLRNDSKKKIKRKAKRMRRLLKEGTLTADKAEQIFNSWLGHASYGSSYNFIRSLIARNDYIYLDDKGTLKINEEAL